jgi:uncharacterized protein
MNKIVKKRLYALAFVICLLPGIKVEGQSLSIKVLSKDDSISIRWAPSSYDVWAKGNQFGYKVERFLVSRDEKITDKKCMTMLHEGVIKPLPEKEWEFIVKKDSTYAPIALQALWGETFELTSSFRSSIMQAYNKVRENESRFGFAMYCADRSLPVAKALGVYYVDKRIMHNEKFIYCVYINAPAGETVDTAYVVVDPNTPSDLYIPRKPQGSQMGNSIILNWESLGTDYVGYHVERSYDGRTFKRITKDLVIPFASKGKMVGYYSDSLDGNREKYTYRIIGVTPFTNYGPYSDTVQIRALKTIASPSNLDVKIMSKGQQVLLTWKYEGKIKDLSHFTILRSPSATGEYELVGLNIQSSQRLWIDTKPLSSGYYKVVAISKLGFKGESLEVFAQLTDDTPPLPPVGLVGIIDTLGVVRLTWMPNTEKDLMGYRVFRSNGIDGEYAQLSKTILINSSYTDTITLNTLTKNVFYKLAAVDKRYNSSDLSDVCVLKRPDIVPPAPPIITSAKCTSTGVLISWLNSPSSDLKSSNLYRIQGNDTSLVAKPVGISSIEDTLGLKSAGELKYSMVAVDSADNLSTSSNTVIARCKGISISEEKIILKGTIINEENGPSVLLEWNLPKNAKKVLLYKSLNEGKLTIYKTLLREKVYIDKNVIQGLNNHYLVRIELENGSILTTTETNILL